MPGSRPRARVLPRRFATYLARPSDVLPSNVCPGRARFVTAREDRIATRPCVSPPRSAHEASARASSGGSAACNRSIRMSAICSEIRPIMKMMTALTSRKQAKVREAVRGDVGVEVVAHAA